MDHNVSASSAVYAVVGVGISNIEREVFVRVGVHLLRFHGVESLGCLAVAFPDLRAKVTRPPADRISLEQSETAAGVFFPDLDLRFLLEEANENRRVDGHMVPFELRQHLRGQRLERAGYGPISLASREHLSCRANDQGEQRTPMQ